VLCSEGTAAVEIAQVDEPGSAAIPVVFRMAAARVIREDDPDSAAMHDVGKAAARVTREDELRSAAMPSIGKAAAPGTREGDGVSREGGLRLAAEPIV